MWVGWFDRRIIERRLTVFKKTVTKIACAVAFGIGYAFGAVKKIAQKINSYIKDWHTCEGWGLIQALFLLVFSLGKFARVVYMSYYEKRKLG